MVRLAADLRQRHGLKGRPTPAARLHLSLNFVGTFRGPPTRAVMEKAKALADKVQAPAFALSFNQVEGWNDDTLVLLGGEGVVGAELLDTAIHKALVIGSMAPRRQPPMTPHITLLGGKAQVPRTLVDPIAWTAREFVLLDSVVGEGRHEVLGRWALNGS